MSTRISIIFSYAIKIIHRNKHKTRNEIPKTWKWVRLGEIIKLISGVDLDASKYDQCADGIPYITGASNFKGQEIIFNRWTKNPTRIAHCGDLLLTCKGTIGKTSILEVNEAHIARQVMALSPIFVNTLFLQYFIKSQIKYLNISSKSFIPGIDRDSILNLVVPLPPLEEQKRISDKINEIFSLLDAIDSLQTQCSSNANILKDKLLAAALTGRLVEQRPEEGSAEELYCQIQEEKERLVKEGKIKKEKPLPEITEEEEPFEIPKTWKWVRLGEISVLNPKNELDYTAKVAFVPMSYISGGYLSQYRYDVKNWGDIKKDHSHFVTGDIGIAKITPCFQNRKSVIFEDLPNGYGAGSTELSIVRIINKDKILQKYLLWLFKTEYFIVNGIKSFTGTAGQQRIGKNYLSSCLIPLPPLEEQERIVNKLDELLALCRQLEGRP